MKLFCFLFVINCLLSFNANCQSTEEIIQNHIKAIGGAEHWQNVKSIIIEGEVHNEGTNIYSKKTCVGIQNMRSDITIQGRNVEEKEQKYYTIVSPKGGWSLTDPSYKPIAFDSAEVQIAKDELDYEDPFLNAIDKGRSIRFETIEHYNDEDFYKFSIQYKSGKMVYCYLHSKTYMIDKIILINATVENTMQFKEYVTLPEGIVFAKQIQTTFGLVEIKSVKINSVVSSNVFEPNVRR